MNIFCLLWIPLVYRFRSSFSENEDKRSGIVPALLFGLAAALVFMPLASLLGPSPFGLTRWLQGFLIVSLVPALLPLLLHFILYRRHRERNGIQQESFILLYAVPIGVVQSISSDSQGGLLFLVVLPVLWTALAIGIPGMLRIAGYSRGIASWASYAAAAVLPFVAATAYWAFFIQESLLGAGLAALSLLPAVLVLYRPWRLSMASGAKIVGNPVDTQ